MLRLKIDQRLLIVEECVLRRNHVDLRMDDVAIATHFHALSRARTANSCFSVDKALHGSR